MHNIFRLFIVVALITVAIPNTSQAHWFGGDDYVQRIAKAKITMIEAIQKASEAQGGTVVSAELDDWGDEGAVYEIGIIKDGEEYEMFVDAITGKLRTEKKGWFK
ncbi:MAG: PepSY domain-containing protein [Alphaproteobacteria bacterium]